MTRKLRKEWRTSDRKKGPEGQKEEEEEGQRAKKKVKL
jgi:hypothetical protein